MSSDKMTEAVRRWRAAGWTVTKTQNQHWRLEHPQLVGPLFTGSTPSDYRSLLNIEADMRRRLRAVAVPVERPVEPVMKTKKSKHKPASIRQERFVMRTSLPAPVVGDEPEPIGRITREDLAAWRYAVLRLRDQDQDWNVITILSKRFRREIAFRDEVLKTFRNAPLGDIEKLAHKQRQRSVLAMRDDLLAQAEQELVVDAEQQQKIKSLIEQAETLSANAMVEIDRMSFQMDSEPAPSQIHLNGEQPDIPTELYDKLVSKLGYDWRPVYANPRKRLLRG